MLKNRFSRFLLLLIMGGGVLGVLYLMEPMGFVDELFPNISKIPEFHLWLPVLPTVAVCAVGQLIGDIFNIKAINDNGFVIFLKRILFIAATALIIYWYGTSMLAVETKLTELEGLFLTFGVIGPFFVFVIYVFAYLFWWTKKLYPFFLIFASLLSILVTYFLVTYWADGTFYVFGGLILLCVVLWFTKPDERIFEEYDNTPLDPKKVIEELAYLNDIPAGLEDDYDKNGNYVGAKCKNCAYYKPFYDQYGLCQPYCMRGNDIDCHEYGYCGYYKKNYE